MDLLPAKETRELSIINSPSVKTVAFSSHSTHLELVDLPQLSTLTIKDCPALALMTNPPSFVRREGEVWKITPADRQSKNDFLAQIMYMVLLYNRIKEIDKKREWKLVISLLQEENFEVAIAVMTTCFPSLISSMPPRKAGALPLAARLNFLPRLFPDKVKTTIDEVKGPALDRWAEETMKFEGKDIKMREVLLSVKQTYLDNDRAIPPQVTEAIEKIPNWSFIALYLNSPDLIEAYIPLMSRDLLASTIPVMPPRQFVQFLSKTAPNYAKNSRADYLVHATTASLQLLN